MKANARKRAIELLDDHDGTKKVPKPTGPEAAYVLVVTPGSGTDLFIVPMSEIGAAEKKTLERASGATIPFGVIDDASPDRVAAIWVSAWVGAIDDARLDMIETSRELEPENTADLPERDALAKTKPKWSKHLAFSFDEGLVKIETAKVEKFAAKPALEVIITFEQD